MKAPKFLQLNRSPVLRAIKSNISSVTRSIMSSIGIGSWTSAAVTGFVRPRVDLDFLNTYGINSRLRVPIECIAEDFADAARKIRLVRKTVDRKTQQVIRTPIHNHKLLDLLKRPHPKYSWSQWTKLACVYHLTVGKAPARMEGMDKIGRPSMLTLFPSNLIAVLPHGGNQNTFKINWWGKMETVPESEILWWFDPDPLNPYGDGLAKARAADDDVYQDDCMARFNSYYFRNNAFLGCIINIPGGQIEDFEEKFRQNRTGVSNAMKSYITNSELPIQITNLTPPLRELGFVQSREQARDFILQNFQVTKQRIGISDGSKSDQEASDFHNQSKIIRPLLGRFVDFLNIFLVPKFDLTGNLELEFLDPVKESKEVNMKVAEMGMRTGIFTMDEARKLCDEPPLPNGSGNYHTIPVNNVVVVPAGGDLAAEVTKAINAASTISARPDGQLDQGKDAGKGALKPSDKTGKTDKTDKETGNTGDKADAKLKEVVKKAVEEAMGSIMRQWIGSTIKPANGNGTPKQLTEKK